MGIRTEFQAEDEMLKLGKIAYVRDDRIFKEKNAEVSEISVVGYCISLANRELLNA